MGVVKALADYKAKHFSRGNKSNKSTYLREYINFVSICAPIVEKSRMIERKDIESN